VGRKDKSPLVKRESPGFTYFDSLIGLSSSYVVLYDVQDRRAWLSNGLHVLLHLVRASLKHDQDSELAAECLVALSDLQEDPDPSSPQAAVNFLRNAHNLRRPIFPGLDDIYVEEAARDGNSTKTEYRSTSCVLLQDRVTQIACVLEQLIDHQASLDVFSGGIPLKCTPRSNLEGFRFMDVAGRRAVSARVVQLEVFGGAGKSWVDFTRAIKAITLFGEGFGELIKPVDQVNVCSMWSTLPKYRDHLAVSAYDLAKILRQEGNADAQPPKLAPGVFWEPDGLFQPCACRDRRMRSCDQAQVLLPESLLKIHRKRSEPTRKLYDLLGKSGAVAFGRRSIFQRLVWPDRGDPAPESSSDDADIEQTSLDQSVSGSASETIRPSATVVGMNTPAGSEGVVFSDSRKFWRLAKPKGRGLSASTWFKSSPT